MNLADKIRRLLSALGLSTGFGETADSMTLGDKVYAGKVNRHAVMIKARPRDVYQVLVDSGNVHWWCPQDKILVEKITPGDLGPGATMRYRLKYRINPTWHSVVVDMEEDSRIINRFVDGIFEGGVEIWQIKEVEEGTELSHTLIYRINGFIFKIGWILLGGKAKHDELTEEALGNLKRIVEGRSDVSTRMK